MAYDIAIVGAGASGLAAGIAAGRRLIETAGGRQATPPGRVLLLERMPRAGKKILVTGNGRCNLGNRHALEHPYHNKKFATPALQRFDAGVSSVLQRFDAGVPPVLERFGMEACEAFFDSLGLAIQENDDGRLYPRSNMAASVLNALRFGAARAGCETKCDFPVTQIEPTPDGFIINKSITARRVIIAAGGCAAPAQGSDSSGFSLLRALGHRIVAPRPALVQIKIKSLLLPMLKGLRAQAGITLTRDGQVLREAAGEVLFTQDGLSGIAAMEVSREAGPGCVAMLDLLPDYTEEKLTALLSRWQGCLSDYTPAQILAGLLPGRVAEALVKVCEDHSPAALAKTCKRFTFEVTGTRSFEHAQVTAGGADVRAFDPRTMESRIVPGLFACGEALDVDGGCGGFNLHWAWASGTSAGRSAASE